MMAVGTSGDLPTAHPSFPQRERPKLAGEQGERCLCSTEHHPFPEVHLPGANPPGMDWGSLPKTPRVKAKHGHPREGRWGQGGSKGSAGELSAQGNAGQMWKTDIRKARGGTAAPSDQAWEMLQGMNSGVRCAKLGRSSTTSTSHSSCPRQPWPWQRSPSSRSTQ